MGGLKMQGPLYHHVYFVVHVISTCNIKYKYSKPLVAGPFTMTIWTTLNIIGLLFSYPMYVYIVLL